MARLEHHGSTDGGGNIGLPVTQLDFEQAMRDFKTMFPMMEADVIGMVLRSNNGAVDVTIDQLLTMTGENEAKTQFQPPVSISRQQQNLLSTANLMGEKNDSPLDIFTGHLDNTGFTPPPSYQQAVPIVGDRASSDRSFDHQPRYDTKDAFGTAGRVMGSDSLRSKFNWNPPLIGRLPDTFLRLNDYGGGLNRRAPAAFGFQTLSSANLKQRMAENERQRQLSKDVEDSETAQYLEDERIAIFLQNEEFVRELRRNKDFMSTLNMDAQSCGRMDEDAGLPEGPTVPCHEDDAAFKEKLRNMGKASKRKFTQFAKLFSRRRSNFPHLLGSHGDTSNTGRENLFSDDTYTQLENEGSDTESINRTYFETYPDEEEISRRNATPSKHRNSSRNS